MIRILIVDDHRLVRAGFTRMLRDIKGVEVIGDVDSGEAALERIRNERPDMVLMDVRMPGMGGLEATRRALRIDPDLKVIAATVYDDEPFPSQMLEAGAVAYLSKDADVPELVSAIRKAQVGQRYLSSNVARHIALRAYDDHGESPFAQLSGREMQIATMVVGCRRVQEIADVLCLSPKTVNSYRYRIFEKLRIGSDVELTLLALRHGMIDVQAVAGAA